MANDQQPTTASEQAFANRRFDPESYQRELCPELTPEQQVILAEAELQAMDPATQKVERSSEDAENLAQKKQRSDEAAEEFCFLDPADYTPEMCQIRIGHVLTPKELLEKLQFGCGLAAWFAKADRAQIAKQLNPRDVALAYRKIGDNPENLHNMDRWRSAIAEIREEEAGKQPLYDFEMVGLWIQRQPGGEAEYACWLPATHLREYSIVSFDSHGVPECFIPGWRDALIALVRMRALTEQDADRVFGEATGPASKRYKMIMHGLRNRPEKDGEGEIVNVSPQRHRDTEPEEPEKDSSEPLRLCGECGRKGGRHWLDCSRFEMADKSVRPTQSQEIA